MAEAPELDALYEQHKDDGFIVITLLSENETGATATQADLGRWADRFGLEHPVVLDANYGVTGRFVTGSSIGLPSLTLLGPGAEVIVPDGAVTSLQVVQALP